MKYASKWRKCFLKTKKKNTRINYLSRKIMKWKFIIIKLFSPQSLERLDLECFGKNYNIINNPENTIQWGSKWIWRVPWHGVSYLILKHISSSSSSWTICEPNTPWTWLERWLNDFLISLTFAALKNQRNFDIDIDIEYWYWILILNVDMLDVTTS